MTTEPRPIDQAGYYLTMSCVPETVAEVRRLTRQSCALWAFDGETAETAALLISELVTNAIRHSHSHSIRICIERPASDCVRLSVVDSRRCAITPGNPSRDDTGGRGLVLIDALSDQWGVDLLPRGKRIWAVIRAAGEHR
ncbi:ATP-binding protein [Streptomyces sp. NPDC001635]